MHKFFTKTKTYDRTMVIYPRTSCEIKSTISQGDSDRPDLAQFNPSQSMSSIFLPFFVLRLCHGSTKSILHVTISTEPIGETR